jgi:hypothetical protein
VGIHVFFSATTPHSLVGTSTLEVKAVHLSNTSVATNQTTMCHNLDHNMKAHKSYQIVSQHIIPFVLCPIHNSSHYNGKEKVISFMRSVNTAKQSVAKFMVFCSVMLCNLADMY